MKLKISFTIISKNEICRDESQRHEETFEGYGYVPYLDCDIIHFKYIQLIIG